MKLKLGSYVIGLTLGAVLGYSCPARAEAPPEMQHLEDDSVCSPILQSFNGYKLLEAQVEPDTGEAKLTYVKKYTAHHWGLVLMTRENCVGPYTRFKERSIDPKPLRCPEGSVCI